MSIAAPMNRPLQVETDPFAAGAASLPTSSSLRAAFREIEKQIALKTPMILVTGGASTGKTLLVGIIERRCSELDLVVRRVDRGDMVHLTLGQKCDVLLVDEANSLSRSTLEVLSAEGTQKIAATTILFALPPFASHEVFAKHRPLVVGLAPLSPTDASDYLLGQAAGAGIPDLFTTDALNLIVEGTHGSPRLLRTIASLAFRAAASEGASRIGAKCAAFALETQSPLSRRDGRASPLKLGDAATAQPEGVDAGGVWAPAKTPAEIIDELARAHRKLIAREVADENPLQAKAEAPASDIPSGTLAPADSGARAGEDETVAEQEAPVENTSDVAGAGEIIPEGDSALGTPAERQTVPGIASDTSKTPESGPAGREDATPAGYQAMRIPSDIQTPVQSIGNLLEEDDAIEEHRTAREIPMAAYRSRQSVGRLIFIAAGIVLMAALPTIFLERDLYSAPQSRSAQPSAERAGLPRSAPASSPTPPVRTTISVQPVPALRGGEANASQAIEQPVAAGETGKPAPRTEATNKVVQRPLTEEEKAAVARGLEALGVQESDTTNNRDGRPQSAR